MDSEWKIYSADGTHKATATKVEYTGKWMEESFVTATEILSPAPIQFVIGDWLEYRGERFEINYEPELTKVAANNTYGGAYKYSNIKFNSPDDELARCDFLDFTLNDNNLHFTSLPTFSFYASSVKDLADRIQANLDRLYQGDRHWTVEVHPEYASNNNRNISVDKIKVNAALALCLSEFGCNYVRRGRTITIGTAGIPADHLFKMGKGNGLKEIARTADSDQLIVTRLRAYGSERNLPRRYYNSLTDADGVKLVPDNMAVNHLMLPGFGVSTLDPYIDSPNIATLGIREDTVMFDGSDDEHPEIFPSIEEMTADQLKAAGISTKAEGRLDELVGAEQIADNGLGEEKNGEIIPDSETFKITLKDVGFDINNYWTDETPVVSFKSGMLGGREFEIVQSGADKPTQNADGTWIYTLKRVYDESLKLFFPYKDYNAKAGDQFVLLHIYMPDVYIKAASQRLLEHAKEYLSKHDYSRSVYTPTVDEVFMADQHRLAMQNPEVVSLHDTIREGDLMVFEDTDLGIDSASIFIDTITIKEGYSPVPQYEITLKEEKTVGALQKMQNQIDSIKGGQGSGGYNAAQIRNLISLYGLNLFLSKTRADSTPYSINAGQGFTAGDFIAGAKGASVDGAGNAEFESAVIRTVLTVMQLVINEQTVSQGDQIFTEGDTIESCEPERDADGNPVCNADGTQRWWLNMRPRYDGYLTGIREGMVLRGMVNNLFQASLDNAPGSYYTSWMRVNGAELGTSGNRINVTLYADWDVPAQRNFPPCGLMTVARWGHQTVADLQRLFKLSSHEGTLVRYEGVDKPILDLGNIASFIGRYEGNWLSELAGVAQGDEIAYFKTVLGNFIQLNHKGNPIPTIVYTGTYDPGHEYLCDHWVLDADTGLKTFVTETCTYCGCVWQCAKDGTKGLAPGYGLTQWSMREGNSEFTVDFEEQQVCYDLRQLDLFDAALTLKARLYNQDVLSHIRPENVTWTRESYDRNGALRAASDAAWMPTTENGNRRLILKKEDLDYDGTPIGRITFTARVAIDDTNVATASTDFIKA